MITSIIAFLVANATLIGIIPVIGGIIFTLWKYFINPKIWIPIKTQWNDIQLNNKRTAKIYETLGPNGGSSFYDKVVAIDKKISYNLVRLAVTNEINGIGEWFSDLDGRCTYINTTALLLTNRIEDDFLGMNWMNVIHPDDRNRVHDEWISSIREKRNFVLSYRWTNRNGDAIPIFAVSKPVYDSSNTLIGYIAVVSNQKINPELFGVSH